MKSKTNWKLIITLVRSPLTKTSELKAKGYNPFTIRRYRKNIQQAEKELLGLK